jgi:hypothetical protein
LRKKLGSGLNRSGKYRRKKDGKTIFSENFEVFGFFLGNSKLKSTSGVVILGGHEIPSQRFTLEGLLLSSC